MRRVTQSEIGKALGLSAATVGLVVGNSNSPLRARLSAETVSKIRAKAQELGYTPHKGAQMLRSGRSNLIVLLNFGGHTEIGGRRSYHVGRMVHEAGFDYQTIDAYWWVGEGRKLLDQIIDLRPRGVIVSGSMQAAVALEELIEMGIPVVSIGGYVPHIPWVRYDARAAIKELTMAAVHAGRRRLTLLLGAKSDAVAWQNMDRVEGFGDAIREAGGDAPILSDDASTCASYEESDRLQSNIVYSCSRQRPFHDFEPGMDAAGQIISRDIKPDALICTNDKHAIGAMTTCSRRGVAVPGELWVTGFDNISFGTQGPVSLTSVDQRTDALCEAAFEMLMARLDRAAVAESIPEERVIPCEIIWRDSTASTLHSTPPAGASLQSQPVIS